MNGSGCEQAEKAWEQMGVDKSELEWMEVDVSGWEWVGARFSITLLCVMLNSVRF